MKITYDGPSDFQEFSKADFRAAEVADQKDLRFAKGVETEVPDSIGKALTSNDGLFGGHAFSQVEEPEGVEADSEEVEADSDEIISQGEPATPATGASTGRGTSTRSARRGATS